MPNELKFVYYIYGRVIHVSAIYMIDLKRALLCGFGIVVFFLIRNNFILVHYVTFKPLGGKSSAH